MKGKFTKYILIILMLGTIFGLSIRKNNNSYVDRAIDVIAPGVVCADSDTVGEPVPKPPPPPII
ncbi:MAG: hypothetical protein ACPL28_11115 [bacterium]